MLATFTKPDVIELTYGARAGRGRVVSVDPQGVCPGLEPLRWSPVTGAHDTKVADLRASAFVAGTSANGGRDDAAVFCRRLASTVLACLLHAAALNGAGLRHVLRRASRLDDPAPRAIPEHHPGAGPGWADRLTDATTGDDRTVGHTRATLAEALACLAHAEVVEAIDVQADGATDIEALIEAGGTLHLLGKACAYGSVSPLITAMTEVILDHAEQLAFSAAVPACGSAPAGGGVGDADWLRDLGPVLESVGFRTACFRTSHLESDVRAWPDPRTRCLPITLRAALCFTPRRFVAAIWRWEDQHHERRGPALPIRPESYRDREGGC
ncbi:hypothetical protein Kisp01_70310 [Kineosporia sp. NBRC 101677]|nr:hypothetical protein Kisp01_70310 [Kineosporia sp. NBRC 101677]